jgi:hypothetical protein
LFLALFVLSVSAQEMIQPRRLVEAPTAGVLPRGYFDFACLIYPSGEPSIGAGLNLGINVGITNRLMFGLSYGGEGLVGRGRNVRFNSAPGFIVKYRIFEESVGGPGLALGYDHQGYGGSADSVTYDYIGNIYKSPGFFLALSKNYLLLKKIQFGMHLSANYSMEDFKEVKWPNATAGVDFGVNEELGIAVEYDFGLDIKDPVPGKPDRYGRPLEGYLNLGLRWAFSENFYIEFDAKDVLENRKRKNGSTVGWGRELKLVYISNF